MKLSERERRLVGVFGILAALFAVRLLWRLASSSGPVARTAVSSGAGAARTARAPRAGAENLPLSVVAVRTDRLDPSVEGQLEVGRDPFRFGAPPPPPPPPPPTAEELEREQLAREERERLRQLAFEQAQIPKPPEVTLRFLGSFGTRDRRIAVFADAAGDNVYNALAGDTLEGKFIVDSIGFESVDLKFVDFPDFPARRLGIEP